MINIKEVQQHTKTMDTANIPIILILSKNYKMKINKIMKI